MPSTMHFLQAAAWQQEVYLSMRQKRSLNVSAMPKTSMALHAFVARLIDAPSSLSVPDFSSTVTGIPTCNHRTCSRHICST